jgi:hypothetical protein
MENKESHLSDEDLLKLADSELPPKRDAEGRRHLAICSLCRMRLAAVETVIKEFIQMRTSDPRIQLPSADGPRALLKARLARVDERKPSHFLSRLPGYLLAKHGIAHTAAALCLAVLAMLAAYRLAVNRASKSNIATVYAAPLPDRNLTPGSTRAVTSSDVCSARDEQSVKNVPTAIQQAVFEEYGIAHPRPKDYELDYLITPELGGSNDVRNLWPETHTSVWNSYVKDQLEYRLHQLVCDGKLDLPTAQREIATDWISAYKKYFDTDRPLSMDSTKS